MSKGRHRVRQERSGRGSSMTVGLVLGLALAMAAPVAADSWSEKVTGGGQFLAGGTAFSVTTSASDTGGQIQYSRSDLSFHATVECVEVSADGSTAVTAGPARGQDGTVLAPDAWVKLEVQEGGDNPDRVRVVLHTGAVDCTPTGSYPGVAVDANFTIRQK